MGKKRSPIADRMNSLTGSKQLIFFDSTCKLCQNAIRRIQERDAKKQFTYFPLSSEMAKQKLPEELLEGDTIVLLENGEEMWIRSKAIFRILKLLGGKYAWMGVFAYVPGLDFLYRAIAHNRHLF